MLRPVTGQAAAEKALRESEARFRTVVNHDSTGVLQADTTGRMTLVNRSWCQMLGYSEVELLQMTIADITDPAYLAPTLEAVRRLAGGGPDFVIEKRYRRKDGSLLWVSSSVNALRGSAGEYLGMVAVVIDLTGRKRTEALVTCQKQAFEMAASGMPLMEVLEFLARAAESQSHAGGVIAIHLLDESATRFEHTVAPGLPPIYAGVIDGMQVSSATGPCCAAVSARQRVAVADVAAGGEFPEFASFALPLGIRAGWSTPILGSTGKVLGTIANYYREVREPDQQDEFLSEIVTRTAAIIIERKRAEEALRQSETRYRTMFEAAPVAVFVCNSSAVIQDYNRRAEELWGRTPRRGDPGERYCGSFKLYLPDGTLLPHSESPIVEVLRTGIPARNVEVFIERPDGSRIPVTVNFLPLLNEQGEITGAITSFDDISERKRSEAAVHQRTAQFQTLLNVAPLGVYLVDGDFRIREVNPTALQVFGNIPDLIGRDFDEVIHALWPKASADEIAGRFRHTLETGESYIVPEETGERLDSNVREYYEWQINRIPLPEGGHGVVCYFRDITRQVLARAAIAESGQRLRFMAESMPQKIFTATANGDLDYVNRQWTEFGGLSFEQNENWGWTRLVHPDDLEQNVRLWHHSVDTGEPFRCVHRFRRADGEYRWHLSRALAMRDGDGKISMWIGSNTDIHEEKKTEEELRLANQDLNLFAFAASHDLQEPLRMITSYSQLLVDAYRRDIFDQDAEKFVGFITDGTRRMEKLLADLLTYTALALQQKERAGPIDLNGVLAKVRENLKAAIEDSGAVITADPLPRVLGSEVHFVQLFQNLIANAIKYQGEHPPAVRITGREDKGEWHFEVADNGIGIAPEYHQQIFGVFKRLHGKKVPGTGVGLAICQRVVERHGGRIWVESEPGKGTTFCFTLPVTATQ